jgi:hypothetical protein
VEGVTAGADLDYFNLVGAHVGDGVLAEALADVLRWWSSDTARR